MINNGLFDYKALLGKIRRGRKRLAHPSFLHPNLEKAEVPCLRLSSPIFCSTLDMSVLGPMDAVNLSACVSDGVSQVGTAV